MASAEAINALRRMINDVSEPFDYSTEDLNARLDSGLSPDAISATVWREKAAKFSELVDISESGSSRKLSDLRKGALEQAAYYDGLVAEASVLIAGRPRTRPISRPSV